MSEQTVTSWRSGADSKMWLWLHYQAKNRSHLWTLRLPSRDELVCLEEHDFIIAQQAQHHWTTTNSGSVMKPDLSRRPGVHTSRLAHDNCVSHQRTDRWVLREHRSHILQPLWTRVENWTQADVVYICLSATWVRWAYNTRLVAVTLCAEVMLLGKLDCLDLTSKAISA